MVNRQAAKECRSLGSSTVACRILSRSSPWKEGERVNKKQTRARGGSTVLAHRLLDSGAVRRFMAQLGARFHWVIMHFDRGQAAPCSIENEPLHHHSRGGCQNKRYPNTPSKNKPGTLTTASRSTDLCRCKGVNLTCCSTSHWVVSTMVSGCADVLDGLSISA